MTAYELRISDWSSDVCSSDLQAGAPLLPAIDLDANSGVTKSSYNMGMPKEFVPKGWLGTGRVALNFGFDLDLWGRNRAALAAATSEAQAAEIDARQARLALATGVRSEEHTSELQSLMRISYAVFCLKKKTQKSLEIALLAI